MKPLLPPLEDYYQELKDIWDSKWLTNNGTKHKKFKKKLKEHLNIENLSLFVNGTLALDLAVKALNLEGEVITTPFTFAATSNVIVSNGLIPVYCDIEMETFNIDPKEIEKLITGKTSAIMPVHIFGNPADVKKIQDIADKYNLKIIYDAAQAFGVEIDGKSIADFGDISMFSFHATKVFNSIEGGLLTYKNYDLEEKLIQMKNFGFNEFREPEFVGTNAKMNEFQAIMGLLNLQYYQEEISARKRVAKKYRELLVNIKGIRYLDEMEDVKHNYAYFPILVEEEFPLTRDELVTHLNQYNIYPEKYYNILCNQYKSYKNRDIKQGDLNNANYVADRILSLPIYGELKIEQVSYICECINELI